MLLCFNCLNFGCCISPFHIGVPQFTSPEGTISTWMRLCSWAITTIIDKDQNFFTETNAHSPTMGTRVVFIFRGLVVSLISLQLKNLHFSIGFWRFKGRVRMFSGIFSQLRAILRFGFFGMQPVRAHRGGRTFGSPGRWDILLMVKKSGDNQLRLDVYSHYLHGFFLCIPGGCLGFLPHTVVRN